MSTPAKKSVGQRWRHRTYGVEMEVTYIDGQYVGLRSIDTDRPRLVKMHETQLEHHYEPVEE